MERNFEKEMTELQVDMINICNEYSEGLADAIYIYASYEGSLTTSHFYRINNKVVECHKVNDAMPLKKPAFDISGERQEQVLIILMDDIRKIKELCDACNKEMPSEFRIVYDLGLEKMNAEYKYGKQFKKHMGILDVYNAWYEEEKAKYEN